MPDCPKCGHWLTTRTEYNHGLHTWEPVLYCIHGCCLINPPLPDHTWDERDTSAEGSDWTSQRAKNRGKTFTCRECGEEFVSGGNFTSHCPACLSKKRSEARQGHTGKTRRRGLYVRSKVGNTTYKGKPTATGQPSTTERRNEVRG